MPETPLKGVTVNGIPLDSYLGEVRSQKIEREVLRIVRESKSKHIHYHPPRTTQCKPKEERNGPVMTIPNAEIHTQNLDSYIQRSSRTKNVKNIIIGILLAKDKELSLYQMKKECELRSDNFQPKAAQFRVFMGQIMKSELSRYILKEFTEGRQRGAKYFMTPEGKNKFTFDAAIEAANEQKKKRTKSIRKDAPAKDKIIDFVLTDKNELPVLEVQVRGKIDININFNFGRG